MELIFVQSLVFTPIMVTNTGRWISFSFLFFFPPFLEVGFKSPKNFWEGKNPLIESKRKQNKRHKRADKNIMFNETEPYPRRWLWRHRVT